MIVEIHNPIGDIVEAFFDPIKTTCSREGITVEPKHGAPVTFGPEYTAIIQLRWKS